MKIYSIGLFLMYLMNSSIVMASTDMYRNCECGKTGQKIEYRIIGGSVIQPNLYPWMAAIFKKGKLHCGGSLINNKYVLTAGHCIRWVRNHQLTVILGMHDRVKAQGRYIKRIGFEKLILHRSFKSYAIHDVNDIGLIKLKDNVYYSEAIKPVCLPKPGSDYTNLTGMVTGWGRTAQNGNSSRFLRKAGVKVIPQEACMNTTVGENLEDTMLCAYEFGNDACQGDSGGPLVYEKTPNKVEQIGVVSWGLGCAQPGIPGVYTKVTEYLQWIKDQTKDAIYCER